MKNLGNYYTQMTIIISIDLCLNYKPPKIKEENPNALSENAEKPNAANPIAAVNKIRFISNIGNEFTPIRTCFG